MDLLFPHARLLVYDELKCNQLDCATALIRASIQLELIDTYFSFNNTKKNNSNCIALDICSEIILAYLSKNGIMNEELAENIWYQICSDLNIYQEKYLIKHCSQEAERVQEKEAKNLCTYTTPILLDFLLQHLQKHL